MQKEELVEMVRMMVCVIEKEKSEARKAQHIEHMLILGLEALNEGIGLNDLPFKFNDTFIQFVVSTNDSAMKQFGTGKINEALSTLLQSVDLFLHKHLHKYVRPIQKYAEMKALTFRNLACIYLNKGSLTLAGKANDIALNLFEILIADQQKKKVYAEGAVRTLLDSAAIFSAQKKHEKAQEKLQEALEYLATEFEISPVNSNEEKQMLELKMACAYSLAVEDEHLLRADRAKKNYTNALVIAEYLKDEFMTEKINKVLQSFK